MASSSSTDPGVPAARPVAVTLGLAAIRGTLTQPGAGQPADLGLHQLGDQPGHAVAQHIGVLVCQAACRPGRQRSSCGPRPSWRLLRRSLDRPTIMRHAVADSYSGSCQPRGLATPPSAKRTTRRGRSTPPRGHTAPDAPNPRATVHEATRRSTCHGLDPTERPTRSHARVGMTPLPAASAGTTLMGRGTSNVLSYRYATSPESGHTGYSTTKVAGQQGYERSDGALTLRIPFQCGCESTARAPDGDLPAFPLVSLGVEPPAGIEPATPSLPWNHQEPLCGPPSSQVAPDRRCQS